MQTFGRTSRPAAGFCFLFGAGSLHFFLLLDSIFQDFIVFLPQSSY